MACRILGLCLRSIRLVLFVLFALPLILLAALPVLAACQGGKGAPVFGTPEQAPTRTIAGERVELERYGGTWVPVAEVAADDRPTQDLD